MISSSQSLQAEIDTPDGKPNAEWLTFRHNKLYRQALRREGGGEREKQMRGEGKRDVIHKMRELREVLQTLYHRE